MEPLRGGYLAHNIPEAVQKIVDEYPEKRPLVEWSFRWLYNIPEATVIISGTNNLKQLKHNIEIFKDAKPNVLSKEDIDFITAIRKAYEGIKAVGCTGCKYCLPCPQNVAIPEIFSLYNNTKVMDKHFVDALVYKEHYIPSKLGADSCVECGICVDRCPQKINIPEELKRAHKDMT